MEDDFEMKDRGDEDEETPVAGDEEVDDDTVSFDKLLEDELDETDGDSFDDKDEY